MAFKRMEQTKYPPRLWSLVGYPGSGKSTFAAQMHAPLLVVDSDHRFGEVLPVAMGDILQLSENPADQVDPSRIADLLAAGMPGSGVRTIVVDSLTTIISPLVTRAIADKAAGRTKSLAAGFLCKAMAMRELQDAVTRWGCDCLWIWHLQAARDEQAKEIVKATLSLTERARLMRSLNLALELVQDGDRRGVKIVWARQGQAGQVLWDEQGYWRGMPECIEENVYDGQASEPAPAVFPNVEAAIDWALEQGAFGKESGALQHARNAYNKLKKEAAPKTACEMASLWRTAVARRLAAIQAPLEENEKSLGAQP
jgi:hypothetical protein